MFYGDRTGYNKVSSIPIFYDFEKYISKLYYIEME
nr:MAG TPA: hypothetical protein [Caudoviricetes sp.]